ncbi:MAG TPA: hypothetical protein PKA00_10885 [Saprospiraceae bacterium]|nr:hypothetical protein [Saprospiraceae bacterium]HMQ83407.1 hypothetical protein [Saprospiraceae bacterium]
MVGSHFPIDLLLLKPNTKHAAHPSTQKCWDVKAFLTLILSCRNDSADAMPGTVFLNLTKYDICLNRRNQFTYYLP